MKFNDVYKTNPDIDISDASLLFNLNENILVNDGIFQFHPKVNKLSNYVNEVFNRKGCCVFGSDWIGRLFFATDSTGTIKIADGAFREIFDVPVKIQEFIDAEMTEYHKDLILSEYYQSFVAISGVSPGVNQCAGYRKFPRLGGKDTVDNLEITDLDVYWGLLSQL